MFSIKIAKSDGKTPLHLAAQEGHFEVCDYILTLVNDKNPRDENGQTPLHAAVLAGELKICELILKNVENKNPPDNDGETPLDHARDYEYHQIVKLIEDHLN